METQIHMNDAPPLDGRVNLTLGHVDLPRLEARFRSSTTEH
jgi:hypothetical protein